MRYLLPILLLTAISCQNKETPTPTAAPGPKPAEVTAPLHKPVHSTLLDSMRGVWSNETSENGIFDITDSTFYYADDFMDYRYELDGNRIILHYPDYDYHGTITFEGDTLVMKSDQNGVSRFWRFKN